MSHGGHSHGGMDEHSTMAMHASTAKMNHSMDHHNGNAHQGGHGETVGHAMMFHLRTDLNLLFEPWEISTTKVLVGSCIAVLFLSALYEGLKIFRARIMHMHNRASREPEQEKGAVHITGSLQDYKRQKVCSCHHVTQTAMHVVQVVLGYLLMLVVMTYQVYLGIAVILGAGLGYFLFAGLVSESVAGEAKSSPNPTQETSAIVLKVTNFDDIRNGQQVEKLSFSDLAIENKGFDIESNGDCK